MISIERALKQAAWADNQLFHRVAEMPPAALQATYSPDGWSVAHLLQHIASSLEWCRYVLNRSQWTDIKIPSTTHEVLDLAKYVAQLHGEIFEESKFEDAVLKFEDEHGPRIAHRSTAITMTAHHSAEHRTQIAVALQISGFEELNLDNLDLWAYENANG